MSDVAGQEYRAGPDKNIGQGPDKSVRPTIESVNREFLASCLQVRAGPPLSGHDGNKLYGSHIQTGVFDFRHAHCLQG